MQMGRSRLGRRQSGNLAARLKGGCCNEFESENVYDWTALLLKMMPVVQWYNSRPYASRTYLSKVANLPHLRDAPE